jgi:mRNA-degrading endonuclease RelE of RelBE toxin-antitoxin system
MNAKNRFDLIYAPQVKTHLQAIERKYHSLIRRTIETQLQFEPNLETRNRKSLKRPAELEADWEIRFGPDNRFRVFYSVEQENRQGLILAIGIKRGDKLIIGREEINL